MSLEEFLNILEKDEKANKRLAEIVASNQDTRLALTNAVLRNVATRQELLETRNDIKNYIDERLTERVNGLEVRIAELNSSLNKRVDGVSKRMDDVNKRLDDLNNLVRASFIAIVVTLASTILIPLILKFLF